MPKQRSDSPKKQFDPKRERAAMPGEDDKGFPEKIDEFVGNLVPRKWLATAFAGCAVGAFLFFILMIVGFATGGETPEEAEARLTAEVERHKKTYLEERTAHTDTRKKLRDAETTGKLADSKVRRAESERDGAKKDLETAKTREAKTRKEMEDLKTNHAALRRENEKLTREVRTASTKAGRETETVKAERDRAMREASAAKTREEKVRAELKELQEEHGTLRAEKGEQAKIEARAKETFDSIMATVTKIEDPDRKLETLKEMRERALSDIAGTPYERRLETHVAAAEKAVTARKRAESAKAKRDASAAYKDTMKKVKLTKDHDRQISILTETMQALEGTTYAARLEADIKARQQANKEAVAAKTYRDATAKVRKTPNAYEDNLRELEDALLQIEGTRYAAALKKDVERRRKTLKEDVAKGAYAELAALIKKSPKSHDDNIVAAQAALAKAQGTRYEAQVQRLLKAEEGKRLEAIGRDAYDKALAQVKGSTDRAANVGALEQLKAQATGSRWESKIEALLKSERKRLAREGG